MTVVAMMDNEQQASARFGQLRDAIRNELHTHQRIIGGWQLDETATCDQLRHYLASLKALRIEHRRARGADKTPWYFPICNQNAAICIDKQNADGTIADDDDRYQKVDHLHPGEPGYVLYVVDACNFEHAVQAWDYGALNYKYARYVASYRDLKPAQGLAVDADIPF